MASSDRITRLKAIRDALESELQDETTRRAALAAAGHPPPTTYSAGGKNLDWNGYLRTMTAAIKEANEAVLSAEVAEASIYLW